MSKFDLSSAADFSRITGQTLSDANAFFGGRDPNEWDILEASYNGVPFHVFESKTYTIKDNASTIPAISATDVAGSKKITWQGAVNQVADFAGRRKVKYQFPYRDGQTTDDLGRKPYQFDIDAMIFGPRYLEGFSALMEELDKPTPGILVHPIRGEITCVAEDVQYTHMHDSRKAVLVRLTFIEHNFTIGDLRKVEQSSVKAALAAALAVFSAIDTAITAIENAQNLARAVKNRIQDLMRTFKAATGQSLTNMNVTFNGPPAGLSFDLPATDFPSLLPTTLGGLRLPDGTLAEENFQVVRSPSDPFNSVPLSVLSQTAAGQALAVQELKKQVEDLWEQTASIITAIDEAGGSLDLFDTVMSLRQTAVLVQQVYETGVASSNAVVVDYTTPRLMSLREVAFQNGITPDRVTELDLLNPDLLSLNYIAAGTVIKVPAA